MSIEDELKQLIIERYDTVTNFAEKIGISKSTLATILIKGVKSANVVTVIKICQELNINTEDLIVNEKITPVQAPTFGRKKIEDIIAHTNLSFLIVEELTLDDKPMTMKEKTLMVELMYLILDFVRKMRE